jgi:hypothetical protein
LKQSVKIYCLEGPKSAPNERVQRKEVSLEKRAEGGKRKNNTEVRESPLVLFLRFVDQSIKKKEKRTIVRSHSQRVVTF